MEKVKTMQEAYRVFELLGIKEVTKKWQKCKGTEVWELPFKTMYYNGSTEVNRFTIYKNGYVRKMIVYGKNNASKSCYQLNRVCKVASFVKDYKWSDLHNCSEWTGKYRKVYNNERIMIDNHRDRVIYLCNYILKNYYNNSEYSLVGEYTKRMVEDTHGKWWRSQRKQDDLPFTEEGKRYDDELCVNDIKVIINGHRYNLS